MATLIVGGQELGIGDDDYNRLLKSARGNPNFRVMDDGKLIVNVSHIHFAKRDGKGSFNGKAVTVSKPAEEEKSERITSDKLRVLIDKSGLSIEDFAASVGYKPSTVIMALKTGNISQPFSDAVKEKYGGD